MVHNSIRIALDNITNDSVSDIIIILIKIEIKNYVIASYLKRIKVV